MFTNLKEKLKKLHKSWTIWFNAVVGSVDIWLPMAQSQWPTLKGYIPDNWHNYIMGVLVIGNFLLRIKTVLPLDQK